MSWHEAFKARADLIQSVLDRNETHDLVDIYTGLEAGLLQIWSPPEAVLVTEIVVYPKLKALNVFLAAGNKENIIEILPSVEQFAKAEGCSRLQMTGRKGWERVFQTYAEKESVTLTRNLV
jgi:hypothetical protein